MGKTTRSSRRMAGAAVLGAGALIFGAPGIASADGSVSVGSVDSGSAEDIGGGILNEFVPGLGDLVTGSTDALGTGSDDGLTEAPTQTKRCDLESQSGGYGITSTKHLMGRKGGYSFSIVYDTENIPDTIEVFYQGKRLYTTGLIGDDINEGNGSKLIRVPAGTADYVSVKVTGTDSDTHWSYTVHCPS
ncbi:MAG: hypothetical protein WAV90_13805 [Gordonia amarae]